MTKESSPRKTPRRGRNNYKAFLNFLVTHQRETDKALPKKKGVKK